MLIATLGIISNRYANSVQNQLITNNIEVTKFVDLIAGLERGLYQTLIYLSAIKEADRSYEGKTTINEPTIGMLTELYNNQMSAIQVLIKDISESKTSKIFIENNDDEGDLAKFVEANDMYLSLSNDWLVLQLESPEDANLLFNTSISPYFRNRVIPLITQIRDFAISKQNEQNEILTKKIEQANYVIALVSFVFILVSLFIAFYVYQSIANPLKQLIKSAQNFGNGNLDERVEIHTLDEIGELAESFNSMATNLKKRTLARDYLDNIIETIQETLIVTDEEDLIVGVNRAGTELLGFNKEELIGIPVHELYDSSYSLENDKLKSNSKLGNVYEFILITKKGKKIPVLYSLAKLKNGLNKMVGSVVVATDISERKKADELVIKSLNEKEILLAEIHHRVKNNLAVISGILHLQEFESNNEQVITALKESQSRIQSISLVHEKLYHSETLSLIDYEAYVNDLVLAISKTYRKKDQTINITAKVQSIQLNVNQAIPCSLLLNEIIVNSYKHAFNERKNGNISITITKHNDDVKIIVEDDGIGFVKDFMNTTKSLGTTLIKTLTNQLKGNYILVNGKNGVGTKFEINFSLAHN